ncbi:MAG: LamG domain-containing protein, partial [Armatimonadota bacterium]
MRPWVFVALLLLVSPCAAADRGGVLFYAGFEGTADAVAVGDATARGEEGGPQFAPGKRGQALLSGENAGYVSYAVEGNVHPERGSIEFWICPQDWDGTDEKFHVFFEASDPGWLLIYKFHSPGVGLFLISEMRETWSTAGQNFSPLQPGEWHHLAATWSPREISFYLDGEASTRLPRPQIPQGLSGRFLVGDRPWHFKRDARSLVDELYIYDRALVAEEVAWAYEHAADRPPGEDVPAGLGPRVQMMARPRASQREIRVEVEVNPRGGAQAAGGVARLEPPAGTKPAPVRMLSYETGEAVIPFTELAPGEYRVKVTMRGRDGAEIGAASQTLTAPGPPVWRGNKIGIPDAPPPPWTPLTTKSLPQLPTSITCWGRRYELGSLGLPSRIESAGAELLGAPVRMRLTAGGKPVRWQARERRLVEATPMVARFAGSAKCDLGTLEWTCAAEFDGMLRYDLTLTPAPGAVADSMELRVPLDPAHATLYHTVMTPYNTARGAVPPEQGAFLKANWAMYWWLGDEERGLAGFCESDEAWDRVDRGDGFRIERTPTSVDAVWSFWETPRTLTEPWRFTCGLQATPVRDISGWRKWRLTPGVNANAHILWPTADVIRYYGYPQATDPEKYGALVADYHAKGIAVVPYSILNGISAQAPEWSFYGEEWANGAADPGSADVIAYKAPLYGCSPAPDWIDFVVWANERYVR